MIPFIEKDTDEIKQKWSDKIHEPETQRRLVLIIVCIVLLLDNMLYMVIVPIIPVYLHGQNQEAQPTPQPVDMSNHEIWGNYTYSQLVNMSKTNATLRKHLFPLVAFHGDASEDASIGMLFACKAIVQLLINPVSGTVIDRVGYDMPMVFGLGILVFSTILFAVGQSYGLLFFARGLQGVGSAFADTSGLAMIADRYTEEHARQKAMAIALAFISFGSLFAPPFGGLLYEFAGKALPFVILALIALIDGALLLLVMKPQRLELAALKKSGSAPKGTPIYKLILDPYIAVCAGALVMANTSLAFLEPTIAIWMKEKFKASEFQIGMVWLPAFFPHIFGVWLTVRLARSFPSKMWLVTAVGLVMEGICCLIIPFCSSYGQVIVPIMIDCFGIALVDTAILPTMAFLVDANHVSVYGSVYAIADISYCLAYAFGPILAGGIVAAVGFMWLNIGIFISNVAFAPAMMMIRNIYKYKAYEEEEGLEPGVGEGKVLTGQGVGQQYKTYQMNNLTGTTEKPMDPNYMGQEQTKIPLNGQPMMGGNYQNGQVQQQYPADDGYNNARPRSNPNNPFRQQQSSDSEPEYRPYH